MLLSRLLACRLCKAEVAYGLVGIAVVSFCPQEPLSYFAKTSIMEKNQERLFPEFPSVSTQEWMDVIVKDLKGADFNKKLVWKTPEGFDVNPFYRKEDLEHIEYLDARPGDFPYVRGFRTSVLKTSLPATLWPPRLPPKGPIR